jgi:hypothetical protein
MVSQWSNTFELELMYLIENFCDCSWILLYRFLIYNKIKGLTNIIKILNSIEKQFMLRNLVTNVPSTGPVEIYRTIFSTYGTLHCILPNFNGQYLNDLMSEFKKNDTVSLVMK